jgi:hypothetical protein
MLHKALVPSPPACDDERPADAGPGTRALFDLGLRWQRVLDQLSRAHDEAAASGEATRRLAAARRALEDVVIARLPVAARHAMVLVMMPRLHADVLAVSGAPRFRQPAWRRLREGERVLRARAEHAVAALERRRVPSWRLQAFVASVKLLLEVAFVPEPRLAALNLEVTQAGLDALCREAGLAVAERP